MYDVVTKKESFKSLIWVNGLVVASVFDQKPFYMITNVAKEITWVAVSKKVWSDQLRKNLEMKFLRFCISHDYNHEMNDNDIADQLRLQYRMMRFSRNNKWWWALWLWGYEVCLVNAYMMYCRYHQIYNLSLKYNHYTFIEATAKAYIDPLNCWPTRNRLHLKMIEKRLACPPRAIEKRQRCTQFTDRTLCPVTGTLRCRRDETLCHFPKPVPKKKNPTQCQLHMWAFKSTARGKCEEEKKPRGARSRVSCCSVCQV